MTPSFGLQPQVTSIRLSEGLLATLLSVAVVPVTLSFAAT
jgi:hypothetical protein